MTDLPVPTEKDWGNYQEDREVHDFFIGKTNKQMRSHFVSSVIERTEDLCFMPTVPFRYYMLGFKDYILSIKIPDKRNEDASDAASCFIDLVTSKLKDEPEDIRFIMPQIMSTLEYVATNQEKFGADKDLYGDFADKVKKIKQIVNGS